MYEGASKTHGWGSTFMDEFNCDTFAQHREENIYYPFVSRGDWELASFLLHSPLSMADIDKLLQLELVRQDSFDH